MSQSSDSVRAQWQNSPDGKTNGLTLFSGDAFSPSMESSVTRGSHTVSRSHSCSITTAISGFDQTVILNALGIELDVAVAGE
jgi:hypothetical protein